jgi:hypothetical protein
MVVRRLNKSLLAWRAATLVFVASCGWLAGMEFAKQKKYSGRSLLSSLDAIHGTQFARQARDTKPFVDAILSDVRMVDALRSEFPSA